MTTTGSDPTVIKLELPPAPDDLNEVEAKYRKTVVGLIHYENEYIKSLKWVAEYLKDPRFTRAVRQSSDEARRAFEGVSVDEILHTQDMLYRGLAKALGEFDEQGLLAHCLTFFCSDYVLNIYSKYINNCETLLRMIEDIRKKSSLKKYPQYKAMLPRLSSDITKPVRRFPQLIFLMKDMLECIPKNHPDRENLQGALTGIENVTDKLNDRKRHHDMYRDGRQILEKLRPLRIINHTNACLLRQDMMDQLRQNQEGSTWKQTYLCLMNDMLISMDNLQSPEFTWHKSLTNLRLTTSKKTLDKVANMLSSGKVGRSSDVFSDTCEEIDLVVSDINKIHHDIAILEKVKDDIRVLNYGCTFQTRIDDDTAKLYQKLQNKHFELLQVLYEQFIFIHDTKRGRVFPYCASNSKAKHDWCVDFVLAKSALHSLNSRRWYGQDEHDRNSVLLWNHFPINTESRVFRVNVKCAIRVNLPHGPDGMVERLWLCASNASLGCVSIVPLHSDGSQHIETFQVTSCNITCIERVPHGRRRSDSIWMGTTDSKIFVFVFNASRPDAHRKPTHVFTPGCTIVTMSYIDGNVFCGSNIGHVLVYSKDKDGTWSNSQEIPFGISSSVTSIVTVGDSIWASCGNKILIMDRKTRVVQDEIIHTNEPDLQVQFLVKIGVGVWVSFHGKPYIILYHSESKRALQDCNVCRTVNEFLANGNVELPENVAVTSLVATLGLLWIGTNQGIILTYTMPRFKYAVPKITQHPQVAPHGHCRPVRFLLPLRYDPVSGVLKEHESLEENQKKPQIFTHEREQSLLSSMDEADSEANQEEPQNEVTNQTQSVHTDSMQSSIHEIDSEENLEEPPNEVTYPTQSIHTNPFQPSIDDNDAKGNQEALQNEVTDQEQSVHTDSLQSFIADTDSEANEEPQTQSRSLDDIDLEGNQEEPQSEVADQRPSLHTDSSFDDVEPEGNQKMFRESVESSDVPNNAPSISSSSTDLTSVPINENSLSHIYPTLFTGHEALSPDTCTVQETLNGESSAEQDRVDTSTMPSPYCNTILVVSGGNGYIEWGARSEDDGGILEPGLIFWIYKA